MLPRLVNEIMYMYMYVRCIQHLINTRDCVYDIAVHTCTSNLMSQPFFSSLLTHAAPCTLLHEQEEGRV
jgi:hypothetical protein